MSKKNTVKKSEHKDVISLVTLYERGNFFQVRKEGKILLTNSSLTDDERKHVKFLINASGIDPLALLAGLFTLSFASVVGLLLIH